MKGLVPISSNNFFTKTIFLCILLKTTHADVSDWLGSVDVDSVPGLNGLPLFDEILGYGCWCYLPPDDDYRSNARGKPMDQIDEYCKVLINGYKSASIEAHEWLKEYQPTGARPNYEGDEEECDAQTVFNTAFSHAYSTFEYTPYYRMNLENDCYYRNFYHPNPVCAQKACMAEGLFAGPLLPFLPLETSDIFNQSLVHVNYGGTFDPEQNCQSVSQNVVQSKRECCGTYDGHYDGVLSGTASEQYSSISIPKGRYPYRVGSGITTRSCCDNNVINHLTHDCCNGLPVEFGHVCLPPPTLLECSPANRVVLNPPLSSRTVSSACGPPTCLEIQNMTMLDHHSVYQETYGYGSWLSKQGTVSELQNEFMTIDLGSDLPIGGLYIQGHGFNYGNHCPGVFCATATYRGVTKFRAEYWKDGETDFVSSPSSKIDYFKSPTAEGYEFGSELIPSTTTPGLWQGSFPGSYKYSVDNWGDNRNFDGSPVFDAMWTQGQYFEVYFDQGIIARYIKILPTEFTTQGEPGGGLNFITMRAGVMQCLLIDD